MYLCEPERTEFDLRWTMFGIPVRVHPFFWVLSAILGWPALELGFEYLIVWILCVFVSVLIHELGHVFMGRVFGSEGHIVLYSFGGLAIGSNSLAKHWQRIAVSFAGPLAGFLYLGLVILGLVLFAPAEFDILVAKVELMVGIMPRIEVLRQFLGRKPTLTEAIVNDLFWINLFWGLINLLPIWPLDGGQISRDLLGWLNPRSGVEVSLGISMVLAGLIAVQALSAHYGKPLIPFLGMISGIYLAIMFGLLAYGSFQELQRRRERPWREYYPSPWERERDDWRE